MAALSYEHNHILTRPNVFIKKYPDNWRSKLNMKPIEEIKFDHEPTETDINRVENNFCPKCGSKIIWADEFYDKTCGYFCENYYTNKNCKYEGLTGRLNPSWFLDNNQAPPSQTFYL